jgi:inner membrane protein COX18
MLLPPLIHLPVFIGTTLTIREACNKSESSLQLAAQAINENPLAATVNDRLTSLALESFHWCPSLTDVDPYSALPVLVGLTALLNVELQANIRQTLAQLRDTATDDPSTTSSHSAISGKKSTATSLQAATTPAMTPKHTTTARPASSVPRILQQKKALSTSDGPLPKTGVPSAQPSQENEEKSAMRSRAITNVLRFASIVFIPVAAASPVVSQLPLGQM